MAESRQASKRDETASSAGAGDSPAPIFSDPTRHRYILFRFLVAALLIAATLWMVAFSLSLYYVEKLPKPRLPDILAGGLVAAGTPDSASSERNDPAAGVPPDTLPVTDPRCAKTDRPETGAPPRIPLVYAHLPITPDWAGASFGGDCGAIDVLMPEWFTATLPDTGILQLVPEPEHADAIRRNRAAGVAGAAILPVLTITWQGAPARQADPFSDPATRKRFAEDVGRLVGMNGYSGICIQPQYSVEAGEAAIAELFVEVGARLAADGKRSCLIVRPENPLWRDGRVTSLADIVVLLAFREPGGTLPTALAPQGWFEGIVSEAVRRIGTDRLVVALGAFGYDWVSGQPRPARIGYAEAMRIAGRSGGRIGLPKDTLNTTIGAVDADGRSHEIRLLDAVSAFNQRVALERRGVKGIAVWSIGYEDPGIWSALRADRADVPRLLERVALEDYVGYEGEGPLFKVASEATPGDRRVTADTGSGLILAQGYGKIPQPFTIDRLGIAENDQVVLTFDDGPSAEYTPAILDILRQRGVPAVFFLIGENVLDAPDVVRAMVADGHEIGSHTFFHPDITFISDLRQRLELNALQRLIVSVTGYETVLFRSPFGRGLGPLTAAQARPFVSVAHDGYATFGGNVVAPDWTGAGPGQIVASVLGQMAPTGGNVVVLHDGGGDRAATVAALPLLIDALRERGYRFTSVSAMLGIDRAEIMLPRQDFRARLDAASFSFLGGAGWVLERAFWLTIALGVARSLIVLSLALLRRRRLPADDPEGPAPSVTVVIPAFNEAEVILRAIGAALASDYHGLNVIVVDDGSTDGTYERVKSAYADDPRVVLLQQANRGKWRALDTAYAQVRTEVVVAIDADTVIRPDAIRKLVRAFRDPKVGAVAGKVEIGNQRGLLTRLQALEYITAQNIDRRAAEVFNGILVVPGAIGAWRAEAVRRAGLYASQTMAEDADMTVAVLRAGYSVVFEPGAVGVTEAPRTLRHFLRQRLRWSLGMMQTAWKHRRAAREGRAVGWISIPDLWLFGVGLSLLGPLADIVLLGAIVDATTDILTGRPLALTSAPALFVAGYLALPLIDVLAALVAFAFERKAPTLVLLVPLQRLVYRPLLYLTIYRALWRALTGRLAAWDKFSHTGMMPTPER